MHPQHLNGPAACPVWTNVRPTLAETKGFSGFLLLGNICFPLLFVDGCYSLNAENYENTVLQVQIRDIIIHRVLFCKTNNQTKNKPKQTPKLGWSLLKYMYHLITFSMWDASLQTLSR